MNTEAAPTASTRYTVLNAMIDIIAAPSSAFDEIRRHPRWFWWPLLVLLGLTIGAFVFYYSWVDFEWLVNETVRQAISGGMPADQADMIRNFMSPTRQMLFTVLGVIVFTLVVYAIQAAYLNIVNKVVGDPSLGYGQWFSFAIWTAFVGIINALAIFAVILLADSNQLGGAELAPLSANALLIHAESGDAWFTWGNSLSLVTLWTLGLMTFGFSRWTGSSMTKSALVAVTPWALVFGIWALLIAT
ncbi:MAG TPA: YIP1 family protein [Woeseiaceae bacterium]|nr:YIP1 family protein [Woeseiaceae bacterium]